MKREKFFAQQVRGVQQITDAVVRRFGSATCAQNARAIAEAQESLDAAKMAVWGRGDGAQLGERYQARLEKAACLVKYAGRATAISCRYKRGRDSIREDEALERYRACRSRWRSR